MHAILLSIGDELALGQTVDTNTAWLAGRLSALGISTLRHETVADHQPTLVASLKRAAEEAPLLIVTGGLGPTEDDLTREALAQAMGVSLVQDQPSLEALHEFFRGRGREMPERNAVQTMHPQGSTMIPNACGTAPGIRAKLGDADVFVTPGVPREMFAMYESSIEPALLDRLAASAPGNRSSRRVILTAKLNTFGLGESDVAERLGPLMARDRNPTVGTTVSAGLCSVRIRAEFSDPDQAQQQLDDTIAQARASLGPVLFGCDDQTLQDALVQLLKSQGKTVTTAESCTGGLIGSLLTDVPGSSAVYPGGWVTYSNALKAAQLGVPSSLLEEHGAVSEPVVRAMAEGARKNAPADYALSVSGIAGPDGGTADKPVGTVWFALATPTATHARMAKFVGDRAAVRDRAAKSALQMLRLHLLGQPLDTLRWFVPASVQI